MIRQDIDRLQGLLDDSERELVGNSVAWHKYTPLQKIAINNQIGIIIDGLEDAGLID